MGINKIVSAFLSNGQYCELQENSYFSFILAKLFTPRKKDKFCGDNSGFHNYI